MRIWMTNHDEDARGAGRDLHRRGMSRLRRDFPLAFLDAAVVFAAYLVPLVLRFDGRVPPSYWRSFWTFLPVAVAIHLLANHLFGLYGQMWRYASVQEARRLMLSGSTGGVFVGMAAVWLGASNRWLLPLSVLLSGAVLVMMGSGAIRFQSRLFRLRRNTAMKQRARRKERTRILLVGAGDAGAMVLKDILQNPSVGLDPVGIVDDDPRKVGRAINGVPVLGNRAAIPSLVTRLGVDQVLMAIPSATSEVVRDLAALCEEAEVTLRVLPSVREIVGGRVTARDIRDLRIEDLLGRQQANADLEAVGAVLRGRAVLVTGAGGSIGSEIARQVAAFRPSGLLLLDHDETLLHEALADLEGGAEPLLVDVRDRERVLAVFMRHRPEVVFHAAAHKHVPVLEAHPEEALATNVLGTANVADAAVAAGTGRFVYISSDKAVRPVSVMGASKRFGEQIVRSLHERRCVFCAVRFGNVLGSRGSVIPTFLTQIARGGPVTVTDPGMARYFMSIHEAVQLVLQAAALSTGGEIFTLEMGEPVNILDLAKKVIRLSGQVPGKSVEVAIIGPRPGEKLVEDLVDPDEEPRPSPHPGIVVSRPTVPDRRGLRAALRELEALAAEGRTDELRDRMKALASGSLRRAAVGDLV